MTDLPCETKNTYCVGKKMNDGRGSSNNENTNNWLGFCPSSNMKMETNTHQHQDFSQQTQAHPTNSSAIPNYFYLSSSPHLTNPAHIYSEFQSPNLSVMPLKSDGSLCIMKALSTSLSQGGAAHEYAIHQRDAMVLSPGSAIYNHESFRQQHEYHSGLNCNNFFCQTTTQDQDQTNKQPTSKDKIPCLNTWIDNYHHALEQHHINIKDNSSSNRSSMVGWGGELKCLSLSMSPGSQSSCVTASTHISPADHCEAIETKKRGSQKLGQNKQTVHRKSIDTFGQRTSQYRGVTRHRWTGRYEAHLWDNSCKKEGQTRKGRQVYLGGYDREEKAARAYDLAALKYWGHCTHINFALENYHQELEEMKNMSRQEYVAHLRRKSSGFSRGASIYRGVTRHHQHGRWQARIGRVAGNKDLYLGTFSTQEEAAEAYDIAAIKFRGANAVTNFDILRYDIEKIMTSNTLPTGDLARRNKEEKPNYVENKVASACDWQMVQYNRSNGQVHENITVENYQNPAFSVALQDLIGIDTSQTTTMTTSPSSSRETLPGNKYAAAPVFFEKPNNILASKFINPASNIIVSWIPTAQLRPVPLTTAHFPSFKAWNDT